MKRIYILTCALLMLMSGACGNGVTQKASPTTSTTTSTTVATTTTTAPTTTTTQAPPPKVVHTASAPATPGVYYDLYVQVFGQPQADQAYNITAKCENANFDPHRVSHTDDHGLMQINRPSWQKKFSVVTGQPWNAVYDPYWNLYFAKWLNDNTGGRWYQWSCGRYGR